VGDDEIESSECPSPELVSSDAVVVGVVLVGAHVVSATADEVWGMVKATHQAIKPAPAKALTATPAVSWWSFRKPALRAWIDF
jgi:hypothetical protein